MKNGQNFLPVLCYSCVEALCFHACDKMWSITPSPTGLHFTDRLFDLIVISTFRVWLPIRLHILFVDLHTPWPILMRSRDEIFFAIPSWNSSLRYHVSTAFMFCSNTEFRHIINHHANTPFLEMIVFIISRYRIL